MTYPNPPVSPGPQPPHQPMHFAPPPKKKSNVGLIIGVVVAVFAVLCVGGSVLAFAVNPDATSNDGQQVQDVAASKSVSPCDAGRCSAPTTAAPAADQGPAKVGTQLITYDDGLSVQVNSVKKWSPPSINAGHKPGNAAVRVQVTLHNKTGQTFDCSLTRVQVSFGAEGIQADQIFADGSDSCDGSIANGRKKTWNVGFSAATKDTSVIQVSVEPSWDHEAAIFEGKA